MRLTPNLVQAYFGYDLIKTHVRVGKWQRSTDWDDFPPEKAAFFRRTPDWCRHRAEMLGEAVKETVEALLEDHALYHCARFTVLSGSVRSMARTASTLPVFEPTPSAILLTAPLRIYWRRGWSRPSLLRHPESRLGRS